MVYNSLLALSHEGWLRTEKNVGISNSLHCMWNFYKKWFIHLEILYKRCAGLDIHSETIVACVLIKDDDTNLIKEIETLPTLTKDLFYLLKWLEEREVTHIAMESKGSSWKPVYKCILEVFFDITLTHAQWIKNVSDRKTDVSDAEWIAKLLWHRLIEKSFVPSENIRKLHDLTHLRKKWIGHMTSEKIGFKKY